MAKLPPLSNEDRENLVAYLDGELDAKAARALEARLNLDAEARAVIAQSGFGDFFGHGLGHGIGLQIHEAPWMRPESDTELQAGMVVTVEPGIYLPGFAGVRIEDDVLVNPEGCEVLTSVPKTIDAAIHIP